jgi:putative transposase
MKANQAIFPVRTMCRMLGLSPSGYYAWLKRPASERSRSNEALLSQIERIHVRSRSTYGRPRVYAELRAEGHAVNHKRVGRLMRAGGFIGVTRRRKWRTTVREEGARPAPDLVKRDFTAIRRDQLWVADITYVPTATGFLFLAVVLDAWSRRVVGWAMESHLKTDLVLKAFEMAVSQRRPENVIHHSDQGTQYTSIAFGLRCKRAGVRPSMGTVGDAYDNAMCESFFATLECELLDRERFQTQAEARMKIFDFIEGWYNPHRRHSSIGYRSPLKFERAHLRAAAGAREPSYPHAAAASEPYGLYAAAHG